VLSTCFCPPIRRDTPGPLVGIEGFVQRFRTYTHRRMIAQLQREGLCVNPKQVYRMMRESDPVARQSGKSWRVESAHPLAMSPQPGARVASESWLTKISPERTGSPASRTSRDANPRTGRSIAGVVVPMS